MIRAVQFAVITLLLIAVCDLGAQTSVPPKADPTPAPVGGPTSIFTVYDGKSLRKGEYTFSKAYSNYDEEPGENSEPPANIYVTFPIENVAGTWSTVDRDLLRDLRRKSFKPICIKRPNF